MNYLLCFTLIVLIFLTIIKNKGEVFSPSIMMLGGFLICNIVLIAEQSNWNYYISVKTYVLIISSCLMFIIGDFVISKIKLFTSNKNIDSDIFFDNGRFLVDENKIFVIALIFYSLIVLVLQVKYFLQISSLVGNTKGIFGAFSVGGNIRSYVTHESLERGFIETLIIKGGLPVSFIAFFLFCLNVSAELKVKHNKILLLPMLLFMLSELFTTNRIGIINCCIYMLVSWICILQIKKHWFYVNPNKKIIKIAILTCILLFVVFRLSGFATQRGLSRSMFDQISDYTGASIVALDIKVCNNDFELGNAADLFSGFFRITNKLGLSEVSFSETNASFVYWQNGSTNIYTAICAYISSIGYLGNYFTFLFMGVLYGCLYSRIKESKSMFSVIVFSWLIFAPTLSCIADRFYTQIFIVNVLIQIIEIYILIYFFVKPKLIYEVILDCS